ncbi:hypothetical protein [Faecalibacillus intestinalis]|nr:hypothetical protein [Faecalibacillus intestinalis]
MNSIGALIGGATVVFAIISAIIFVVMITLAITNFNFDAST